MRYAEPLVEGRLIRRYKRFLADVELAGGEVVTVHVPNTGSMLSSRAPGSPVGISRQDRPERKLKWTLELVSAEGTWVGVNTSRTNGLVEEAIRSGRVASLKKFDDIRREVRFGERSRVDLVLERGESKAFIEVKNVTYRVGKKALFPDAVTERGTRHLRELMAVVEQGHRGVIFFAVNRSDCTTMGPAADIDPLYAQTLRQAVDLGVEALAYRISSNLEQSVVDRKLPVRV